MKSKTHTRLFVLIGLLLLLGIVVFSQNILTAFTPKDETAVFAGLKKDSIQELSLSADTGTTSLYKKNGYWVTKKDSHEYTADTSRVEYLIDALVDLKRSEPASTNKKNHPELGINKQKITFTANGKSNTLYIGNPTGTHYYVRINDESTVFTAAGFDGVLTPLDYRDLKIHLVQKESDVTAVSLASNGSVAALTKNKDRWNVNQIPAKKESVDNYISDLKSAQAEDIVTKDVLDGLSTSMEITITENKKEKHMLVYQTPDAYFVTVVGDTQIYKLSKIIGDSLKKSAGDFTQ